MITHEGFTSTIDWNNRSRKRANDEYMYDVIFDTVDVNKENNVLCLPGAEFRWESTLALRNIQRNWKFYGLCPMKLDREHLKENAYKLNQKWCDSYNSETRFIAQPTKIANNLWLEKFVNITNKKFAIIYADWFGGWFSKSEHTIRTMFSRKLLENNSVLIFTIQPICARSETTTGGFKGLAMHFNTKKQPPTHPMFKNIDKPKHIVATKTIHNIIMEIADENGYSVELSHFGSYRGDEKKQDMFTFTYKCKLQQLQSTASC